MDNLQRIFLRQAVCRCVQQVFSNFKVEASENEPDSSLVGTTEPLLVSILGFKSKQMSGSLLLGCDDDFLRATYPTTASEADVNSYLGRDWLGEISNLIAGRLKNSLLGYGLVLKLNPPSISESTYSIFETYSGRLPAERFWFTVEGSQLCLLLCADVSEKFEFKEITPAAEKKLSPGTAILSLKSYQSQNLAQDHTSNDFDGEDEIDLEDEDSTVYINNVPVPEDVLSDGNSYDEFETLDDFDEALDDAQLEPQHTLVSVPEKSSAQASKVSIPARPVKIETLPGSKLKIGFEAGAVYTLDLNRLLQSSQFELTIEGFLLELEQAADGKLLVRFGGHELLMPIVAAA